MQTINFREFGFFRVGVAIPSLIIGDPIQNIDTISFLLEEAAMRGVKLLVFPELSLTGYTAADLFHQELLLEKSKEALINLVQQTKLIDIIGAVGMPLEVKGQLFNVAVLFHQGKILGIVPKTFIPNYHEFYERRWFSSAIQTKEQTVMIGEEIIPFGADLLFYETSHQAMIGVEICEDLWMPISPSSHQAVHGATVLLNLSASNELVGKSDYRRDLVKVQSGKTMSAYLYVSSGQSESTTDLVFSGHAMIAENGSILKEERFQENCLLYADIDLDHLRHDRQVQNSWRDNEDATVFRTITFSLSREPVYQLERKIEASPFVPKDVTERHARAKEIFQLQAMGLAQRLKATHIKKAVIGISGGLDSTLALLATIEAFRYLQYPLQQIIGITMPGFGTTNRTYQNAIQLLDLLGVTRREIPIRSACEQHFSDIEQDPSIHNVVFENTQARERTQILMDIANQVNGLVVGTGDLSELALGWATYNGDHMSMYAINASIPKTLVRYIVEWVKNTTTQSQQEVATCLQDILDTPVSPELLPPGQDGTIQQKTEQILGNYDLHDFYLYHFIRWGTPPKKLYQLARQAFTEQYTSEFIKVTMKTFYQRFFTQQFKRSCMPDGVKVGSISLSPRGDWRMPSDASAQLWLREIEQLLAN